MQLGNAAPDDFTAVVPREVLEIIAVLEKAGHEAYAVGGCVRDGLLGQTPKDWDITTSARPEEVKALFKNTYDTGIEHGTVSVRFGVELYEVTTYRVDGTYTDHRRPDSVRFTGSLKEDLARRDFTVNAMAWHPERGVVDPFDGQKDLAAGIIRCVGDPFERFEEDALRMLRAYRFAARYGFIIEPATERAIRLKKDLLDNVSRERVREEMEKILCSGYPGVLRDAAETGLLQKVLPEWTACENAPQQTPYHAYPIDEHTIRTVEACPPDRILRWAALVHDIAKPQCRKKDETGRDHFKGHPVKSAEMADAIFRRLRFDNDTRELAVIAVRYHDADFPEDERQMRKLLSRLPDGFYPLLLELQKADASAKNMDYFPGTMAKIERAEELYRRVIGEGQCVKMADMKLSGRDLLQIGFASGPEVGRVLNILLARVLEDPHINERTTLLAMAMELKAGV